MYNSLSESLKINQNVSFVVHVGHCTPLQDVVSRSYVVGVIEGTPNSPTPNSPTMEPLAWRHHLPGDGMATEHTPHWYPAGHSTPAATAERWLALQFCPMMLRWPAGVFGLRGCGTHRRELDKRTW